MAKRQERIEHRAELMFAKYFATSISHAVTRLRKVIFEPIPQDANVQAYVVLNAVIDRNREADRFIEVAQSAMLPAFIVGARSEEYLKSVTKLTSAQELADKLELEIPDNISLGPYPDWMLQAAAQSMNETFAQSYWQKVPETTWGRMQEILETGIEDGHSINTIANNIMAKMGSDYSRARAKNVARTEVGNFLNAGAVATIKNLQQEAGFSIGKEWLSVMGSTTRQTHADANGQKTKTADGLFNLAGYRIPWPSHHSLPAGERCNCQCVVLSAGISEELFGEQEQASKTTETSFLI